MNKKTGDSNMKNLTHKILMLGGIYFIVSFVFSFSENEIGDVLYGGVSIIFIILLIILCFKKNFAFLNKIDENYKKTTRYLVALGMVEYFSIIFGGIPALIYGYNSAMAIYNDVEYTSQIPLYMDYLVCVILILAVGALLWASYVNFIKKKN